MKTEIRYLHNKDPLQKLKVAAYARVSRDKEELENSLENQIRHYTTLINSYEEFEFAGIYADDGISGGTIKKRNQFKYMLQKAFAHEIDIILVKSISRFARNVVDLLSTIQELRDEDVEVYFEKENISTLDTKSDNYLTLYSKFAEEELNSMGGNVRWSIQQKLERGNYRINAVNVFGYYYDEDRNFKINEKEAKWVRVMFQMYIEGNNTALIADFLERNNVKTVTGLERWTSSSIRRILRNEKYCGDVLIQKSYSENSVTKRRIINHGERQKYLFRDVIPPIVSRSDWLKAQEIMNEHKKIYHIGQKNCHALQTHYTGFGYCPYCGSNYFRKFNRKVEMLYCSSNKDRCTCKESESVYIEHLDKIIPILIKKLKVNEPELRKRLMQVFSDTNVDKSIKEEIDEINGQIEFLNKRLDDFSSLAGDGMELVKNEIKKEIANQTDKKLFLENEIITSINPAARTEEIIKTLRTFPDVDSIGDFNFRALFKRLVIVNRDRLIFVVGDDDLNKLPNNINKIALEFIETFDYRVRSTTSRCTFGIYINK
ncbi:MAG: recombinase family protein [Bacilli bacterium]|nr:recombinase family protein [Bacilli bacterium]